MVNFALRGRGDGFVVKLEEAKVIRQHMLFFFPLYNLISYIIIFEIKKIIFFFNEIQDKWSIYIATLVEHFCRDFEHDNFLCSSRGFKYLPNIK